MRQDIKIFNVALSQSWKVNLEYYKVISRKVPETTEMSTVVVLRVRREFKFIFSLAPRPLFVPGHRWAHNRTPWACQRKGCLWGT